METQMKTLKDAGWPPPEPLDESEDTDGAPPGSAPRQGEDVMEKEAVEGACEVPPQILGAQPREPPADEQLKQQRKTGSYIARIHGSAGRYQLAKF